MRRALLTFLVAATVLFALGIVWYAYRARAARARAAGDQAPQHGSMSDMPMSRGPAQNTTPAGTPRGEVTLDPRRQQLIGVRTVPVKREALVQTLRTVGLVRYDETRLADVNLKIEGWIRELYVDYTGQAVRQGQPLF